MIKVVIITGANSGIGLATANILADKGYKVYGISRNYYNNEKFENYQCDINNYEEVNQIFQNIYDKEGKIDVLINNAGIGIAGAIEHTNPNNIQEIINTNLTSLIISSSKIIPFLRQNNEGKIINISSVGGIIALPFQACYSATKAGVETFSKALAIETKPYNIKVTAILPGDTKTNFTETRKVDINNNDQDLTKRMEKSIKKMSKDEQNGISPDKVAKVIYKVIKRKNPPLRISVGIVSKLEVFLTRLLPTKLINYIIEKMYG